MSHLHLIYSYDSNIIEVFITKCSHTSILIYIPLRCIRRIKHARNPLYYTLWLLDINIVIQSMQIADTFYLHVRNGNYQELRKGRNTSISSQDILGE